MDYYNFLSNLINCIIFNYFSCVWCVSVFNFTLGISNLGLCIIVNIVECQAVLSINFHSLQTIGYNFDSVLKMKEYVNVISRSKLMRTKILTSIRLQHFSDKYIMGGDPWQFTLIILTTKLI
jgi:hypothetical protein